MGLHLERDNWLQTGALDDSTVLRYTETKSILNKFPGCWDGCIYLRGEKLLFLINEFRRKMINHLYIPITKSHW